MSKSRMKSVQEIMLQQQRREMALISSFKQCSLSSQFKDIEDIKQQLLKVDLEEKFYDAKIMGALFCIFDTIMLTPGSLEASDDIHNIIPELRRIGAESVEGVALLAKFGQLNDTLILKAPKDPRNDNLFHEYFVGVSTTNKLRKDLPNFAYILAAFKCGGPAINQDKSVERWCSRSSPGEFVNYVVYEKIPGKDLGTEVATCTPVEYFSWIMQACIAIQTGADMYGFTHYDLHDQNVLLRNWSPPRRFTRPGDMEPDEVFTNQGELIQTQSRSRSRTQASRTTLDPSPRSSRLSRGLDLQNADVPSRTRIGGSVRKGTRTRSGNPSGARTPAFENSPATGGGANSGDFSPQSWFFIPYRINGEIKYLRTDKITTFIDYGRSRVEVNGESFGAYGFESFGIYVNQARPSYDIYKLIGFSLMSMLRAKNMSCFSSCYKLYQIFIDQDMIMSEQEVITDIERQYDNYFEYKDNVNLWDYLDVVKEFMPDLWQTTVHDEPNGPILQCEDLCPSTVNQAASDFKQTGQTREKTALEEREEEVQRSRMGEGQEDEDRRSRSRSRYGGENDNGDWEDSVRSRTPTRDSRTMTNRTVVSRSKSPSRLNNAISRSRTGGYTRDVEEYPITSYRSDLSQMRNYLDAEFGYLGEQSLMGLPRSMNATEFEGFLSTYVEPQATTYGKVKKYKEMLEALDEYNELMGIDDDLSEYKLCDEGYGKWRKQYDATVNRLARTYVPEGKAQMKQDLLEML